LPGGWSSVLIAGCVTTCLRRRGFWRRRSTLIASRCSPARRQISADLNTCGLKISLPPFAWPTRNAVSSICWAAMPRANYSSISIANMPIPRITHRPGRSMTKRRIGSAYLLPPTPQQSSGRQPTAGVPGSPR